MRPKTERRKLIDRTVWLAKTIAKTRDEHRCKMCGTVVSGSNCHGSHVIPVSADHRLELHPINIKTLCYHCHLNVWHKNPLECGEWYELTFPEKAEWLRAQKIYNKTLGSIKITWLAEWYEKLREIETATCEEIVEWERRYIDGQIHNWV